MEYLTKQQIKMVEIAGRLYNFAIWPGERVPRPGSLPTFQQLCEHWYLEVSPTIPLYSIMNVYNWLIEHGYYNPYCL